MPIYVCDVDQTKTHMSQYPLQGVPTLMIFKDAKPVSTLVGAHPKNSVENWLNENIK